ncbi:hypothetical protein [Nocardia sp. AG03]|uniref:hypothetical protein n=1 Tax=Nocardia sp. AG03 TaxID=3025312 RepID=UPI0024188F97|nr:hypothetical protein [Nocardia sp. AG03]
MTVKTLETPDRHTDLYEMRSTDVTEFRPYFTGDILEFPDASRAILVQHPCALRNGVELLPNLMTVRVVEASGKPRSDWHKESPKLMPLPELLPETFHVARFTDLSITPSKQIETSTRIAILSAFGVNLLMQRWVYHNTRVIIPTHTFDEQMIGPSLEADLACEWREENLDVEPNRALTEFGQWLDSSDTDGQPSWRSRLPIRQAHSVIRRAMRAHLRDR